MTKPDLNTNTLKKISAPPRLHQRAAEIQAYGTVNHLLPLELEEPARLEITAQLKEVSVQLSRLLDAHQIIIRQSRKLARQASELGDDGTNDLLVRQALRTNELQVWFLSEQLVNVPLVMAENARAGVASHLRSQS